MTRIGPRMRELCRTLYRMGGLGYGPGGIYGSNGHGSAVLARCIRAGVMVELPGCGQGNHIPVMLTAAGEGAV